MGESNSKVIGDSDLKRFIGSFQMVRREAGSGLTFCLDQASGREIAIKEIKAGSAYESDVIIEDIQARMRLNHDNVVGYLGTDSLNQDYFIYKPQVCSGTERKIFVVCDYPFKSIKEEIDERVVANDSFSEAELWSILYSCLKGLDFLVQANVDYDAVSSRNVLLDQEGRIKLNDPWLNASDACEAFVCRDDLLNRYLPPELTTANAEVASGEERELANIYSLAVVLLECIELRTLDELDTTAAQKSIIAGKLLKELDRDLSLRLRELLRRMLEATSSSRPSYLEVLACIDHSTDEMLHLSQAQRQEDLELSRVRSQQQELQKPQPASPTKASQKTVILNSNMLNTKKKPNTSASPPPSLKGPQNIASNLQQNSLTGNPSSRPKELTPSLANDAKNPFSSNRWSATQTQPLTSKSHAGLDPLSFRNTAPQQPTRKLDYDRPPSISLVSPSPQPQRPPMPSKVSPIAPFQQTGRPQEPITTKQPAGQIAEIYREYDDGSIYEGGQRNGKRQGYGRMIYPGGREYIGHWAAGCIEGEGRLFNSKKELIFEGLWKHNTKEGKGCDYNEQPQPLQQTFDYRDLTRIGQCWSKYEGNFLANRRQGVGRLTLTNTEVFEGQFEQDIPNGNGVYLTLHRGPIKGVWKKGSLLF